MERSEVVKGRLIVKPIGQTMHMQAICSLCERRVSESTYNGMHEYNLKAASWRRYYIACPYCNAVYKNTAKGEKEITWSKRGKDYIANVKNGTFFVFKMKNEGAYRWSFKSYSEQCPSAGNTGAALSKEIAFKICESHKEWMV